MAFAMRASMGVSVAGEGRKQDLVDPRMRMYWPDLSWAGGQGPRRSIASPKKAAKSPRSAPRTLPCAFAAPRTRSVVVRAEEGAAPAPKKEVGPKRGSQVRRRAISANGRCCMACNLHQLLQQSLILVWPGGNGTRRRPGEDMLPLCCAC